MTKCIICKKTPQGKNALTDEHIFPEFIGGNLKKKNVCSSCNSHMGSDFEGRLENGFLFRLFSYQAKIVKKSGLAKSPFVGDYESEGRTYEVDEDFNYKLKFTGFQETESNDGNVSLTMAIDERDYGKVEGLLVKKLTRKFKNKGKNFDEDKLKNHINHLIKNSYKVESVKPELQKRFEIDRRFFCDLKLLALKIMFESIHYFDEFFSNSKVLKKARISLEKKNIDPFLKDKVFFCDEEEFFIENLLPKYSSYMIIIDSHCFLKIADWYLLIVLDYKVSALCFIISNLKGGDVFGDIYKLDEFVCGGYLKKLDFWYMPSRIPYL